MRELVATPPRSSAPLLFTAQVGRVPWASEEFFIWRESFCRRWREPGRGVPTLALTGTWSLPVFGPVRHAPSCVHGRPEPDGTRW